MKPVKSHGWYHGSPYKLTHLLTGSTITQDYRMAEVFSHKPHIVSIEDDGSIRHDGKLSGYLYVIIESINSDDIEPVPHSTMQPGKEFLAKQELSVQLIKLVPLNPVELLSPEEVTDLIKNSNKRRTS